MGVQILGHYCYDSSYTPGFKTLGEVPFGSGKAVFISTARFADHNPREDLRTFLSRSVDYLLTSTYIPIANFTCSHNYVLVNKPVNFDASNSYDIDGSIIDYEWEFNDGNIGFGKILNHSYNFIDLYNVTLSVTDNENATDSITKPVTVYFDLDMNWLMNDTSSSQDTTTLALFHNASDDTDEYDVPDPGAPPNGNLSVYFSTAQSSPYHQLMLDARPPEDIVCWNVTVQSTADSEKNVTVSWNTSICDLLSSTGSLFLVDDGTWVNMRHQSSYTFSVNSGGTKELQIMLGQAYITNASLEWNMISVPFNQSIHKNNMKVMVDGTTYSWNEAVSNGFVLDFLYEWDTINQTYATRDVLHPGQGCWLYSYDSCDIWADDLMNISDDDYVADLTDEWNLIGSPHLIDTDVDGLIVHYNGSDYSWQNATSSNNEEGEPLVLGFVYGWDAMNQTYYTEDKLLSGDGYWLYAYEKCTLFRSGS